MAAQPTPVGPESHHPPGAKGEGLCYESHGNNPEQEQGQAKVLLKAKGRDPDANKDRYQMAPECPSWLPGPGQVCLSWDTATCPSPTVLWSSTTALSALLPLGSLFLPPPQPLLFEQSQDKQIFVCTSCINVRSALGTALSVALRSQDERGAPGAGWEPVSPSQTSGSGLSPPLQPWQ